MMRKFCSIISAIFVFWGVGLCGALAQSPTATTDKASYAVGEQIKITLVNNGQESIFSHLASKTPFVCIQAIEQQTREGGWQQWDARCKPPYCTDDTDAPAEINKEKSADFLWSPMIYIIGSPRSFQPTKGTYRLVITYQDKKDGAGLTVTTNEFTVK